MKAFPFSCFLFLLFLSGKIQAQVWSPLGGGTDGGVAALIIHNGKLFAGGNFLTADNPNNYVANVAQWNDTAWSDLNGGANYGMFSFCEYNGEFYAGGRFSGIGGIYNLPGIAKWNGSVWDSLDSGITPGGWVSAMIVFNGKLIVGGNFSRAGNLNVHNIAVWDGANWSTLGNGFSHGNVTCLEIFNGELYAGGSFDSTGSTAAYGIAKWDGNSWSQVGEGFLYGIPLTLKAFNGKLYAGGSMFCTTGFHPMHNFAVWDNVAWNSVGSGANNFVDALFPYGNKLYIGGRFTQIGGTPNNRIAEWDGTNYYSLGSGVSFSTSTTPEVDCIYADDGVLYAGGAFNLAGGNPANNIARFDFHLMSTDNIQADNYNVSVFPNPNNGIFSVSKNKTAGNSIFEIYNVLGEKINSVELINDITEINLADKSKGIYFYRIISDQKIISSGKIIRQ